MSVKSTILDGEGKGLEASVGKSDDGKNALWVHQAGSSKGVVIQITDSVVGKPYDTQFLSGASAAMNVNGSVTPVVFSITPDSTRDIVVTELVIAGTDSGIKIASFFAATALTNGLLFQFKTNNETSSLRVIKSTHEVEQWGSKGGFNLQTEASIDSIVASRVMYPNLIVRAANRWGAGNDDYLKVTVQDDLTGLNSLTCIARGVLVEADSL